MSHSCNRNIKASINLVEDIESPPWCIILPTASLCSDEPLVILPIVKSAARSMEKPYSHHFLSLPLCCCHIFRQFSQQIAAKSEDALAFLWRARASLVCRLSGNFACISSFLMRSLARYTPLHNISLAPFFARSQSEFCAHACY